MPLHKVTCVPRGHALGVVSFFALSELGSLADRLMDLNLQTSQLPKDDRVSISFKEYLAEIDVCMGGRVAEELSGWNSSERILSYQVLTSSIFHAVYGPQNVTSGASSDLRHATGTANAMVKVINLSISHPKLG
jgi:ATP-dependent metalloprotease